MSATSSQGTGLGAAPNQVCLTAAGPHVVAAGIARTGTVGSDGNTNNWWITVDLEEVLPLNPDMYSVILTQSDEEGTLQGDDNQRPNHGPHVEKYVKVDGTRYNYYGVDDEFGNYDNWKNNGLAGFVIHPGDGNPRTMQYVVVKNGFLRLPSN
jgi:hypothetical protein